MWNKRLRKAGVPQQLVLLFFAVLTLYPLFFMLAASFKNTEQFYRQFWYLSFPLHFDNYTRTISRLLMYVSNSLVYCSLTLVLSTLLSLLAGYAFARYRFRGRDALFLLLLALLMLPGVLTLAPMFVMIKNWGWLNKIPGVIIPWTAFDIVFGTFVMRTFFEAQPGEIFEAARLDGAGEFRLFLSIAVPLALPGLGTIAITNVLFTWNDIIWPMVTLLDPDKLPIAVGMLAFQGRYQTQYGPLFAGYVIASLPLVFLFIISIRKFIEGLQSGLHI